jgi:membrane protease YdiL (CAAX protease family)
MWIWDYPIGIIPFALPLIGILFITERHNLSDYYLTKENFWISLLYGAIVTCVVIIPFSIYIVCSRIGQISWLSNQQMAQIGLSPMSIALAEELTYRSVFLRYLREQSFAPITANVIQSIYFCFVHIRYIEGGDYLFVGFTLAVGLLAGWITLKQKNIAGALLIHVTGNLIPLLINNGQMPFL